MEGDWMKEDGAGQSRDGAIDLPKLFRAIARRKWWIILPTLAAFAARGRRRHPAAAALYRRRQGSP